jgi:hypothetical protein
MLPADPSEILATLTHARLRADQGDYPAAVSLLRRILASRPEHHEALSLLRLIEGRLTGVEAGPAQAPARRRIERLEDWLGKIRRGG